MAKVRCNSKRIKNGFTLVELLIVLIIIAAISVMAMVGLNTAEDKKLEVAANEIASAIRFAVLEARRHQQDVKFIIDKTAGTLQVSQPGEPEVAAFHPVKKQPYIINLNDNKQLHGVVISNNSPIFNYNQTAPGNAVFFDSYGFPICITTNDRKRMTKGEIELSYKGDTKKIIIMPQTSQVLVE